MENKNINPIETESPLTKYLHQKAIKNGIPLAGNFELTSRCNFSCKMCYVHSNECNEKSMELPAAWWIETGRAAAQQGMVFLLLTGGEPLLRKDFLEIYSSLKKQGLFISINTNGALLNGEIAQYFKKDPPGRLNVSLYGSNNDTYEQFTGVRAFSTVIQNIESMREMGIDVRLNCSITPDNAFDFENIFNLAKDMNLHLKATSYMYPQLNLNGQIGKNCNRLSATDAAFYKVQLSKLKYTPEEFLLRAKGLKTSIEALEDCCDKFENGDGVRCRAGKSSFWINKEGKMFPCGMMNKGVNVKKLGFEKAWEEIKALTTKIVLPVECKNCKYRDFCNVCAAVCVCESGKFDAVPKYVCRLSEETARLTQIEAERLEKEWK